jgi:hypothetical protein
MLSLKTLKLIVTAIMAAVYSTQKEEGESKTVPFQKTSYRKRPHL